MQCQVCNYDNTPLAGEPAPTHCEGCGTRISGGSKPFPGRTIDPDKPVRKAKDEDGETYVLDGPDDPIVVDDEFREEWPHHELDNVLLVRKATFHWGRGIGCEPDGYIVDERVTVERADEPCPTCTGERVLVTFSQDAAGIAGAETEECTMCGETRNEEHWA